MTDIPPPFDAMWFRLTIGFILGIVIGSFITMLSYRLPRRISIIKPDSFCPKCKTALTPRDLMPVVSWALSRGTCRHCNAKISVRYPLIELASGITFMIAFSCIGFQPILFAALAAIIAIMTILVTRIES